jgi:hypothetical protein
VLLFPVSSVAVLPNQAAIMQAGILLPGPTNHGQGTTAVFRLLVPAGTTGRSTLITLAVARQGTVPSGAGSLLNVGIGPVFDLAVAAGLSAMSGGIAGLPNVGVGPTSDLTPHEVQPGSPITAFLRPLTLQVSYDPQELEGLDTASLRIAYFDVATRRWVPLPTTLDTANHLLTANVQHFTLFQVRGSAHTTAQLKNAQRRLAAQAAAGPPRVTTLPSTPRAVVIDGVPLVVTLPQGNQHAPVTVVITGKAGARISAIFTLARGPRDVVRSTLDGRGYARLVFTPPPITAAQTVGVVVAAHGATRIQTVAGRFTLLPGPAARSSTGSTPASPRSSGLSVSLNVAPASAHRAQTVLATVQTRGGAQVSVMILAGKTRVAGSMGQADSHGTYRYRVAARTLHPRGGNATLVVSVTVRWAGQTASRTAPLVVVP